MEENTISPGDFWEIIKYRKWSLVIPFVLILFISGMVAVLLPAYYRASSTILIEEQEIPSDFVTATVTSYIEKRLQTINQRIMSTGTLVEIINQFNLYADMREKYTIEEIVEEMRNDINMESINADVIDRRTGKATNATIAFTLSYQGKNPSIVHRITNVLTSLYLKENVEIRERQAKETSTFLEDELAKVKEDLEAIDSNITELKEAHLNELPELMQVNLQRFSGTERSIQMMKEQLRSFKEREGYLEVQLSGISSENIDLNKRRLDELRLALIELRTNFLDNYPDIVKIKKEISEIEKQVNISEKNENANGNEPDNPAYITLSSQLASVRSEIELIKQNMADFENEKKIYQRRLEESPRVEEAYNILRVEKANTQVKYNDLMSKFMEAKIAQGLEQNQKGERFSLIDPPIFPEKPFKPNRLAIVLIGFVLSIGASVGVVSLEEMADSSIRKPETLSELTQLPVLSTIPDIVTPEDIVRQKRRRNIMIATIIGATISSLLIFHFFIMDLNVFWAKVMRKVAR